METKPLYIELGSHSLIRWDTLPSMKCAQSPMFAAKLALKGLAAASKIHLLNSGFTGFGVKVVIADVPVGTTAPAMPAVDWTLVAAGADSTAAIETADARASVEVEREPGLTLRPRAAAAIESMAGGLDSPSNEIVSSAEAQNLPLAE